MRSAIVCLLLTVCLTFESAFAQTTSYRPPAPFASFKKVTNSKYPFVLGHRGSPALRPEHTIPSYTLGIQQGADFIECDAVLTKDCEFICRHEPLLSNTTNADVVFPQYKRNYTIDGTVNSGVFSVDLTLAQTRQLRARERLYQRSPVYNDIFEVPTLAEYLELILNSSRIVGAYVETKHPTWHDSLNLGCPANMTTMLVDMLESYGFSGALGSDDWNAQPVFLESFEVGNLKYAASITDIPLIQLLDEATTKVPDLTTTYSSLMTDMPSIAQYAAGIGPYKVSITDGLTNRSAPGYGLVERAHNEGLQVHPYTFRSDFLPPIYATPSQEILQFAVQIGVDGIFDDLPGFVYDLLTGAAPAPAPASRAPAPSDARIATGRKLMRGV